MYADWRLDNGQDKYMDVNLLLAANSFLSYKTETELCDIP